MSLAKDLMQVGIPDQAAIRLGFQNGTIVGAGTTNADAAALPAMSPLVTVTGAANSGVKLSASAELGCMCVLSNIGANTILIYPPTGGQLNGDVATTGTAPLATRVAMICVRIDAVNWAVIPGTAV